MARLQGSRTTTPNTGGRGRVWQSMRILRRFTLPDLVATAETGIDNAGTFVRALTRSGYLRVVVPKRSGRQGSRACWLLVRDTGPLAPRVQAGGAVWDPNPRRPGGPPIGQVLPPGVAP